MTFYCEKQSVCLTGVITTSYIKACKTTPIRNRHWNNDINFIARRQYFQLSIIWAMRKLTMVTDEELVVNRMKRRLAKLSGVQTMCLEARAPCVYIYVYIHICIYILDHLLNLFPFLFFFPFHLLSSCVINLLISFCLCRFSVFSYLLLLYTLT